METTATTRTSLTPLRLWRTILLAAVATAALVAFSASATATHYGCDSHPDGRCGTPAPIESMSIVGRLGSGEFRWSAWPVTPQKYNVYVNGRYRATVKRSGPSPVSGMRIPSSNRFSGQVYVIPIAVSTTGREWIGLRHEAKVFFYWWDGSRYQIRPPRV